ncbi:MAG: DUF4476 domain-containing protein [Crocinitomicaceae bacterium]
MKKWLLFALVVGISSLLKAQNNLVVFNQEGKQFYIILNGIKQNAEPQTNVKIEQLTQQAYKLKVIFADGATPDIDKSIYFGDPNHEYVTEIKQNKKGDYKISMVSYGPTTTNNYQSTTTLNYTSTDAVVGNGNNVNTNINQNDVNINQNNSNQTVTTQQTTTTVTTNTNTNVNGNNNINGENVNMNVSVGGVGMNVNVNIDENGNNVNSNSNTTYTETITTTTNTTITNGNSNGKMNNTNNANYTDSGYSNDYNGCYSSTVDYNAMIEAVKNESFADDKKMIAKQALNNKCISTDQIKGLMEQFSFEDDKLEIAKFCYNKCSDRDNYYKVNSALTYSDSKEELNKYIGGK